MNLPNKYYHFNSLLITFFFRIIYHGKIKIGKRLIFRKGFTLLLGDNAKIIIGNNVFFNNYCSLCAEEKIIIGDNTIFGENVKVYDHNHVFSNNDVLITRQGYKTGAITIGKNCWIASNVTILKGVTVGDNCIIGSGSIIHKNVPADSIIKTEQVQQIISRR